MLEKKYHENHLFRTLPKGQVGRLQARTKYFIGPSASKSAVLNFILGKKGQNVPRNSLFKRFLLVLGDKTGPFLN